LSPFSYQTSLQKKKKKNLIGIFQLEDPRKDGRF
jgi:hypothetical protein